MGRIDGIERLARKTEVDDSTGCHIFMGFCLPNGYGRIMGSRGRIELAHRFSWELKHGTIPEGMCVLHRCDVRACVNPDHLFLGTHADNMADMDSKGRRKPSSQSPKTRGVKHWKSLLSEAQVLAIRSRASEPRKLLAQEFGTTYRYVSSLTCGRKRRYDGLPHKGSKRI